MFAVLLVITVAALGGSLVMVGWHLLRLLFWLCCLPLVLLWKACT